MRMGTSSTDEAQLPTSGEGAICDLRCRFSLMVRCEEPGCRRLNIISAGQDITLLQSRRFYCYMNKQGDPTKCCHVRQPGEVWVPPRNSGIRNKMSTAGKKVAGKSSGRRGVWKRSNSTSSDDSISPSPTTASPQANLDNVFVQPYAIGSNIMVLHGKTAYPGKVVDHREESLQYLVQYDGLSASRSEWRAHREIISIDEVTSNRRTSR